LLALTRANELLVRAVGRTLGLGAHEVSALVHLSELVRLTPSAIAVRLHLPPPTVTLLVDRLEEASFVLRTPDSVDRRKVFVALTHSGEAALSWCEAQWREALCSFDSGYLNGLAEDIVKLTHSVVARASAIPAKVAPHDPSIPAGK
jgi:DNA-binding MarR family transcriptional regulator